MARGMFRLGMVESSQFAFSPERVKRIRIAFGETQEVFAARLGVAVNMISRWETGETEPRNVRSIKALLDAEREAFGVPTG